MAKAKLDQYKVEPSKEDKNEFVSCIIVDENGRPLKLTRKMDQKLDPGKYDLCSGHIKTGEISLQAMIREVIEELGMHVEDVVEIYSLDSMETPHSKLKDTTTHMYCLVTKLSIEEINQKIQNVENREIEEAIFLESIHELRNELKDPKSNWRFIYTDEMEKKLSIARNIIKERNDQREKQDSNEYGER